MCKACRTDAKLSAPCVWRQYDHRCNSRILACIALFATGALVNGWRLSAKVAKCETTQAQGVATRAEAARIQGK